MKFANIIGRADLLKCRQALPESDPVEIAALLGFRVLYQPPTSTPPAKMRETNERVTAGDTLPLLPPHISPSAPLATYLIPFSATAQDIPPPIGPKERVFSPAELRARDDEPPKPPLIRWERLWPYLRQALGCYRDSARINTRELTRLAAILQPVRRIPRVQRLTWAPHAIVMSDRRDAMMPFWDDMDALIVRLQRWRPHGGLHLQPLSHGFPGLPRPHSGSSLPIPSVRNVPVLALSDLGCLEKDNGQLAWAWESFGSRLRRDGCLASALLPSPRNRWNPRLAKLWRCSLWDRAERPHADGRGAFENNDSVERLLGEGRLLNLLAPALRCEPSLLRELRLLLGSSSVNVGTEYDLWHHNSEIERQGLAIALTGADGIRRRERLAKSPEPLMARVRELLERHHRGCAETVRAKELLNLAECGAGVLPAEVEAALQTQRQLGETVLHWAKTFDPGLVRSLGLTDYFVREVLRTAPKEIQSQTGISLGYGVYRAFVGETVEQLPSGVDPKVVKEARERIEKPAEQDTIWELAQVGSSFRLRRSPWPFLNRRTTGAQIGVPLARFWARRPGFSLECVLTSGEIVNRDIRLSPEQSEVTFEAKGTQTMGLSTDRIHLALTADTRPSWATRFGKDQNGQFAEFEVNGVRFPLRWIPPGSFWMGSPEDEKGRFDREGPRHQVTITQGYWLATTPCSSAQWKALMGEAASPDESHLLPVTKVSWKECQTFLSRLTAKIPDLEFFLPTEAEWEYACRAGTESAFNDGSACTNPDGTDPMLTKLGWHGEGFSGTPHPVGQLARNAWGLYDMQGNVWEWCQDGLRAYTQDAQRDPRGPVDTKASRVLRGGSFWFDARFCRSACRSEFDPDDLSQLIGFRLAAGQPGRSAALAPESGAKGRSPTGGAGRGAKAVGGPERPRWAISLWEQDQWGRLAEFELDGALFRFRWVAPGTFLMGSPDTEQGRDGDERQHSVTLTRGFWLGDTPCTQEQWEAVMKNNPSHFKGRSFPVDTVSWNDCQDFCHRLAQKVPELHPRLPSEAEWEYACRAGTNSAFNDGSDCTQPTGSDPALDNLGWYDKNSSDKTHPVRQKQPNAWGLYDMHGNVWEWCHDGKRTFSDQAVTDPLGPMEATARRVLRGGSYWSNARSCRSAYRGEDDPDDQDLIFGFRLAAGQPVWSVAPDPESGAKRRSPTGGAERGAPDRPRATR